MITIPQAQLDAMRAHAEAGYPHEACGILVGDMDGDAKRVAYAAPVRNAWTAQDDEGGGHDLRDRYLIDPEDIVRVDREAAKRGHDIIGFFHSHPDWPSRPSETDRAWAWPVVSFVIVSVRDGGSATIQSWVLADGGAQFEEELIEVVADARERQAAQVPQRQPTP